MLFDDLLIEARRADIDRALDHIAEGRRARSIVNAGRSEAAREGWFSRIFSSRRRTPAVEILEPLAARVRTER
jgi:hypothetical protein